MASLGIPPILEIDSGALQDLKSAHLKASENHKLVISSLKIEADELEKARPQITTVPFDRSNIERLESEIAAIVADHAKLQKAEQDRQSAVKSKISELQVAIGNLNSVELARQSEVKNQISSIRVEISKIQWAEQDRRVKVNSQISADQVELIKAQAAAKLGAKAKEEAVALAKELQKVRSATCPTCDQGWITDACKTKETEILAKLSDHKKTVIAGNEASGKIASITERLESLKLEAQPKPTPEAESLSNKILELDKEAMPQTPPGLVGLSYKIESLRLESQPQPVPEAIELRLKIDFKEKELSQFRQEERDHQFKENAKSQLMVVNFAQKQTELRQAHENTLKYVRDEENKALYEYELAKNKVKAFEESQQRYYESYDKLERQASKYEEQYSLMIAELALITEEIELATEAKKAIKSYLSCSFEDALDSI